jgi:hypothetical protein
MKISKKEELLMRRALDPASSPAEVAKAAEAFVSSLRKRGLNGYDFHKANVATSSAPATATSTAATGTPTAAAPAAAAPAATAPAATTTRGNTAMVDKIKAAARRTAATAAKA